MWEQLTQGVGGEFVDRILQQQDIELLGGAGAALLILLILSRRVSRRRSAKEVAVKDKEHASQGIESSDEWRPFGEEAADSGQQFTSRAATKEDIADGALGDSVEFQPSEDESQTRVATPPGVIVSTPSQGDKESPSDRPSDRPSEKRSPEPPVSLSTRLAKSSRGLLGAIRSVFKSQPQIDQDTLEELEMLLISADLGVKTVTKLLSGIKEEVREGGEITEEALIARLRELILQVLEGSGGELSPQSVTARPYVIMVVGVNGVGKTTSIGKLAAMFKSKGHSVMLAAADTFRAAAVDQLEQWGHRLGVKVVRGADEAKPSTVVFSAMEQAKADNVEILIIDTAGRLHTKTSLMQELSGVRNIISRHEASAPHEVLLVIDGTTGQNGLVQAQQFHDATKLSGIVVTKLDGTAKGGIVVAIQNELGVPVRYIGIGEGLEDLRPFNSEEFVDALLDSSRPTEVVSEHGLRRRRRRE